MDREEQEKIAPIWMPYKEYIALKKMYAEMEPEMILKIKYFFWNNFSHEGYEEWKKGIKKEE